MSKLWYDHLIVLDEVEIEINNLELEQDEKEELHNLIEETLHHRVLSRVLEVLPREHHEGFLKEFKKRPHDGALIDYINERIDDQVEKHISGEISKLKEELLDDLRDHKK